MRFSSGLFLKFAQNLSDYLNDLERGIILDKLQQNNYYKSLFSFDLPSEEMTPQQQKVYDNTWLSSLKKALSKELGISVVSIPFDRVKEFLSFVLSHRDVILNDPLIKGRKYRDFDDLKRALNSLIKEKNLNADDLETYNHDIKQFQEWVDYVKYQSNDEFTLQYLEDYYLHHPSMNLMKFNVSQLKELSDRFHEELARGDAQEENLSNYTPYELRETPNKGQKGEDIQKIELDDIVLGSLNGPLLESLTSSHD